jgi:hypothetical protein
MGTPKILFILGSQRGGTTIFGRLLGEIDGFVFAGAVRRVWLAGTTQPCSCGHPDDQCPVWSQVVLNVLPPGRSVADVSGWQAQHLSNRHSWVGAYRLARRARKGVAAEASLTSYAEVCEQLYREVAEMAGARVVVDTSKHPNDAVLLSQLPGVEAYFIQIVRDPRGSAHSVHQRNSIRQTRGGPHHTTALAGVVHTWATVHAALNWLTRHGSSEAVRRTVPAHRSMLVRYEDLAQRPTDVLQRVVAFVGEHPRHLPDLISGTVSLGLAHSPSCSKRFPATTLPFRLDDRWMTSLRPFDAVVTAALAWPLMRRYGYRLRPPPPTPTPLAAGRDVEGGPSR